MFINYDTSVCRRYYNYYNFIVKKLRDIYRKERVVKFENQRNNGQGFEASGKWNRISFTIRVFYDEQVWELWWWMTCLNVIIWV